MTVAGPDWHAEWVAALDALELDVSAAEALLTRDRIARDRPRSQPWRPPAGLGPLPLDLRPRADGILNRQLAVAEALTVALAANHRQAEMLARVEAGASPRRPSYVDCAL